VSAQLEAGRVDVIARSDLPNCLADRQMLLVVITNLLENALKYSPEDSRVVAETEPTVLDGHLGVVLRVTNQVGLVGPPDRERVFEKYHRGQRARHRSGSGLGLYLSRRLAERMGARLSLRAPVDDRVCFELWVAC
jgi:signal transduction histidine kinase